MISKSKAAERQCPATDETRDCSACGKKKSVTWECEDYEYGMVIGGWGCVECGEGFEDWPAPDDAASLAKQYIGLEEGDDWGRVEKAIYKGTNCGAWINLNDFRTITIGSIVEGVERCSEVYQLVAPFTKEQFWEAVQAVEDECQEIWNETHGCDACGEEDEMTGYIPVNPDCKECGGNGTII